MVTARTKRTTRTARRRLSASNSSRRRTRRATGAGALPATSPPRSRTSIVGPLSSIRIPSSPEVGRHHESEHRADDRGNGDEQDEQQQRGRDREKGLDHQSWTSTPISREIIERQDA